MKSLELFKDSLIENSKTLFIQGGTCWTETTVKGNTDGRNGDPDDTVYMCEDPVT